MTTKRMLILALAVFFLASGFALAMDDTPAIDWSVIGSGGEHAETAPYTLDGTIGQAMVGMVSNGSYELCSGFWCLALKEYKIYLPFVLNH